MHNGHAGEYMNAVLPPHVSLNSNSSIPYYHQNTGENYLATYPYELEAFGYTNSDIKSSHNPNDPFSNHDDYSHKKSIKPFQRPATAKSTEGRLHLETNTPIFHPSFRRGHRKKTLSLNPEEREALESLVEDVIIVGLKDAVLDSDDSSDESNNEKANALMHEYKTDGGNEANGNDSLEKVTEKSDEEVMSNGGGLSNNDQMRENFNKNHTPLNNNINNHHFTTSNQETLMRSNINNTNNNNFLNNQLLSHHNNYMFKPSLARNNYHNNTAMKQREFYLNNFNKQNKDPSKKYFPTTDQLPPLNNNHNNNSITSNIINPNDHLVAEHNNNNSRQSINNMLSINIYPAQLKVAIKHMDSLPPRFLKRLQTGHNRIGGSEPTLQSLSELNLNHSRLDSSLNSVFPACNTSTFSAKTSPVTPSLHLAPLSATESHSACSSVEKDRSKNRQSQLAETKKIIRNLLGDLNQYTDEANAHVGDGGEEEGKSDFGSNYQHFDQATRGSMMAPSFVPVESLFRMNNNRFNSESQLNSLDLQPSHHIRVSSSSSFNHQSTSRQFNSLDVAQGPSSSFFHKPSLDPSHSAPLLKKTALKADAPVFVSTQFSDKCETSKARTSDPEIALLPGVLNANFLQQQPQRLSKPPMPEAPPNYPPYKMHPSHFYNTMPSLPATSNQAMYRGGGYMPMLNYNQPPPPYPSYPVDYNSYNNNNAPLQQSSLFYNHDYPFNQHAYQQQPWLNSMASPPDMYHPNEANQWYTPQGCVPQYMGQPITGVGEEEGAWPELSLEEGEQRVRQLMMKGVSVMAVYQGGSDDKMRSTKFRLMVKGMTVLNLNQPYDCHAGRDKLREWILQKVTETLDGGGSLVLLDQLSIHHDDLNEYMHMAAGRRYEVVLMKCKEGEEDVDGVYCHDGGGDNMATSATTTTSATATSERLDFAAN